MKTYKETPKELDLAISLLRQCLPNIEYLSEAYPLSVTKRLEANMGIVIITIVNPLTD